MKDLCRKFQRLLHVELEDLREDLDLFVEVMTARHESGEITDYVYNENLAVLRNEIMAFPPGLLSDRWRLYYTLPELAGALAPELCEGARSRGPLGS